MALGSTVYNFEIELSHIERELYQKLTLRVARHSSESVEYLLTRVFAYCAEYDEHLAFSKGLDEPDEPALWSRDLTGQIVKWIEVGSPSAAKLHKAKKGVESVAIYTYKNPKLLIELIENERVFQGDRIPVYSFAAEFLAQVGEVVEKRNQWSLTISEGTWYLVSGGKSFQTDVACSFAKRLGG